MDIEDKLDILADAAKYDVSCSSSGSSRPNRPGGLGNAYYSGICHSWTADGRCISLLKILITNSCIYDCEYCVNRRSNDTPRAMLTPEEIVLLTIEFYRRNYIEGLFLSSGIVKSPDYTTELLIRTAKLLREREHFNGYIHMKGIPGTDPKLLNELGRYVDRVSVNIELPSEKSLHLLAPQKTKQAIMAPMKFFRDSIRENKEERKKFKRAPSFVPAGQTTQLIVGASGESDRQILLLTQGLYRKASLKRVYYSAYVPIMKGKNLPAVKAPPFMRENRLYQADWLLRFYQFKVDEIVDDTFPDLDLEIDPKLSWALRHPEQFPVDVNKADYEMILRVPGIGVKSARLIVASRRFSKLGFYQLKKIGVVMKKAQYFITCSELPVRTVNEMTPQRVRNLLVQKPRKKYDDRQLILDFGDEENDSVYIR